MANETLNSGCVFVMKIQVTEKKLTVTKISLVQEVIAEITSEAGSMKPTAFGHHFFSFEDSAGTSRTSGRVTRRSLNPAGINRAYRSGSGGVAKS